MKVYDDDVLCPNIGYFVHRKCAPSWEMVKTVINFNDLTYVIRGEAEYIIDGTRYTVASGDMVFVPQNSLREGRTFRENLMECYSVNFLLNDFFGMETALPLPPVFHIGIQSDIIAMFEELKKEWLCRSPGYRLKVTGLFLQILRRCFERAVFKTDPEIMDSRIKKVIGYMTAHYDESLRMEDFAKRYSLSPMYFGLLFKRATGLPFHKYLMEIRLNNAESMLRSGEHTVTETALTCGFRDTFYFSKAFKKNRGMPPSRLIGQSRPLPD